MRRASPRPKRAFVRRGPGWRVPAAKGCRRSEPRRGLYTGRPARPVGRRISSGNDRPVQRRLRRAVGSRSLGRQASRRRESASAGRSGGRAACRCASQPFGRDCPRTMSCCARGRRAWRWLEQRHASETRIAEMTRQRVDGRHGGAPGGRGRAHQLAAPRASRRRCATEIAILRDSLAVLTGSAPGTLETLAAAAIPLPPAEVRSAIPQRCWRGAPTSAPPSGNWRAPTRRSASRRRGSFPQVSLHGADRYRRHQLWRPVRQPRSSWPSACRASAGTSSTSAAPPLRCGAPRRARRGACGVTRPCSPRCGMPKHRWPASARRGRLRAVGRRASAPRTSPVSTGCAREGGTAAPSEAIEAQRARHRRPHRARRTIVPI